ncbi:beta-lactamase family protein [Panacibacter sp. DH6]|uniref:Beta-lactamase family protein n=1 Tax=Panacibacter microcysteis TaxID=2793269 RepID=A0A931MDL7_9BACT|nr:serine hydrolase domain-containing protein [Panacibacter microcysteis]MBG9378652.1 beta-lactamase family protein [Panacibacter microcysteis]
MKIIAKLCNLISFILPLSPITDNSLIKVNRSIYILLFFLVAFGCGQSSDNKSKLTSASNDITDSLYRPLTAAEVKRYGSAVEHFYNKRLVATGFNGSFLVAKNGEILYEDYKGFYDFKTKQPVDEHSAFHLASISKTFTAMTVLKLWEESRLNLDDSLQKFFPQLPYHGVTVKMLLNHRSGLPNYLYFMDSAWDKKRKATNWDVVNYMIAHKPLADAMPDRVYHYCNTNFVLLALIVEIVTNKPFPTYMKDSVFTPLGLKDTYVFSSADTARYNPTYSVTKPFMMDHLDCTYGDKNVYSTARDLLTWDKVLFENKFVRKSTAEMAYEPYSFEKRTMHNYGLGWHLYFNNGDTIIYHNGKWHGSNTVFTRLVQDTAVLIVLGNKLNRNIYTAKDMQGIFTGKTDTGTLEE